MSGAHQQTTAAEYRVLVSPAASPASFSAELPFDGVKFTEELNRPGSATVTLPMDQPNTFLSVDGGLTGTIEPGRTLLWIERNGALIWGGIVWVVNGDMGAGTVKVLASGFLSYLRRRVIRTTQTFSSVDQYDIARGLIDYAEGVTDSLGLIGTAQATTSGVTRDRTYHAWDRKNIGEAIEQLADVNNGFNFRFDTYYNSGTPTVEFVCMAGTGEGSHGHVFDLQSNTQNLVFNYDGTGIANQVDSLGEGEGPDRLIGTSTQSSPGWPLMQKVTSHSEVSVQATINAHAERERASGQAPLLTITATGQCGHGIAVGRPGELANLRGVRGMVALDDDFMITSKSISFDGGQETPTYFLVPASAYANV